MTQGVPFLLADVAQAMHTMPFLLAKESVKTFKEE